MKTKHIIFLPGMLLDSRIWHHQILTLNEDFFLHFIDYKNAANIEECMLLVDKCIDRVNGEVILVGFSLGGMISYEYALNYGNKVDRLVLIGISPNGHSLKEDTQFIRMKKSALIGDFQALSDKQLPIYLSPENILNDEMVKELKAIVNDCSRELFLSQLNLIQHKKDRSKDIEKLNIPTYWICSEFDELVDFSYVDALSKRMINSKMSLIKNSGHMMTLEKPNEVTGLLIDWMKS